MNEITKFISGLNPLQRKLLIITGVLVVAALFDRLLIGPTMSRLSSIEEDIVKEEATIKQDMRFLGYKDKVTKEAEEIAPFLTHDKATDEEVIAGFLKTIENLAAQAKVTLIKVNPGPGEQDAQYWKYQADLDCSGNFADVVAFMHLVNSNTELMKVLKFSFSAKKADSDEIKATMTIEKIVVPQMAMPPKAPEVNSATTTTSQTTPPAAG